MHVIAVAALLSASAFAQVPDAGADDASDAGVSAEELEALQKALNADKAAAEAKGPAAAPAPPEPPAAPRLPSAIQSLNPDISVITDVAAAGFSSEPRLQEGGHDPRHNGFNLQGLELSLAAAVDPYLRFDSNIVLGEDGIEIEEAYATTLALPYSLQLRAGQFLTRFGRLNATHPHTWDFVDQPFFFAKVFGADGNRGLGTEVSWLTPLPWYVEAVASVNEATGGSTARSFWSDDPVAPPRNLGALEYTLALKQFFALSDDLSLSWGLSSALGPNAHGRSEVYGTDVYLKYRPLSNASTTIVSLQAEALARHRTIDGDSLTDYGGYAYLFWRFAFRWGAAVRYEFGSPAYGLDGSVVADPLDPDWAGTRQRVAANVTFWPTEFSRLRLQGSYDAPSWLDRPNLAVFLAFEVAVGAHGAHKF